MYMHAHVYTHMQARAGHEEDVLTCTYMHMYIHAHVQARAGHEEDVRAVRAELAAEAERSAAQVAAAPKGVCGVVRGCKGV